MQTNKKMVYDRLSAAGTLGLLSSASRDQTLPLLGTK